MLRLKLIVHRIAHGFVHLEHPFHLTYLGAGTHYYLEHEVFVLGGAAGLLFVATLVVWIYDLIGGD